MNRENKRKQHEKGYYKTHPCDESFTCRNCGHPVVPAGAGSDHRNHCPNCLCSVHLDIEPGDRESDCGGLMEPADDNPVKLMSIAMKPIGSPPFPIERMAEITEKLE